MFNITVEVVNANFEYVTESKQFSTLTQNYTPGNVTVYLNDNFTRNLSNDSLVDVGVLWEPALGESNLIYFRY